MTHDDLEDLASTGGSFSFAPHVYVWECNINEGSLILQYTAERKIPNAFHRLMQRLILGFKWRKL